MRPGDRLSRATAAIPAVLVAVAACGGAGGVVTATPTSGPPQTDSPPSIPAATASRPTATPQPTAGRLTSTMIDGLPATVLSLGFDDMPIDITFAFGSVWVADHHQHTVTRINPGTMAIEARVPVRSGPGWFVTTDDALWVTSQMGQGLTLVDHEASSSSAEVRGAGEWPSCGEGVFAEGAIWQPACDAHQIMRIDPVAATSRDVAAGDYTSLTYAAGHFIATNPAGFARFDPEKGTFTKLGDTTGFILKSDGETVWVADETVSRISPTDGSVIATFDIPGGEIAFHGGVAYLLARDNRLLIVDLATNKVTRTITLNFSPISIAVRDGEIWITNMDGNSVIRLKL